MMKVSIIAILMSISAICYSQQDSVATDTVYLSESQKQLLQGLIQERSQIEAAMKNNQDKIDLLMVGILSDPRRFVALTNKMDVIIKRDD